MTFSVMTKLVPGHPRGSAGTRPGTGLGGTTWMAGDTTGRDVQGRQALVALGIRHRNRPGHFAGISCAAFEAKRALSPSSPWPNSGFGCAGHLLYVMGSLI